MSDMTLDMLDDVYCFLKGAEIGPIKVSGFREWGYRPVSLIPRTSWDNDFDEIMEQLYMEMNHGGFNI